MIPIATTVARIGFNMYIGWKVGGDVENLFKSTRRKLKSRKEQIQEVP